jgi:hypothetical protein
LQRAAVLRAVAGEAVVVLTVDLLEDAVGVLEDAQRLAGDVTVA